MVKNNWLSFFGAFVLLVLIAGGTIVGCDGDSGEGNGDGFGSGNPVTTLEIANEGHETTVFVNFGSANCTTVEMWAESDAIKCTTGDIACDKTGSLNCQFTIAAGSTSDPTICTVPLKVGCLSSFVFGIGGAPSCGTTPFNGPTAAEVAVYGSACSTTPGCETSLCDCADITVVNGFTVPISMTMSKGPTTLGPVTSGGLTDNENNLGVFPVGCTTCVTRANCPCPGAGLDCNSNVGCHPEVSGHPDPECQLTQESGGTITVNILPLP